MSMQFTGERMVPGTAGRDELFFEHVVRYAFAASHVSGRRVLDAGCGCGYGSHFLRRAGASEVVGVDVDVPAIRFSQQHFAHQDLSFVAADVLILPAPDQSFDLITCFEVFEHLDSPALLLAELRRVLRPEGLLLLSTPNALTYEPDTADGANPFHYREYSPTEFQELIAGHFPAVETFVQNPFGGMGIFPMGRPLDAESRVEMRVLSPPRQSLWGEPRSINAAAERSAYLIAVCSATETAVRSATQNATDPAGVGRLFAMAEDFSDTTHDRQELDAYVEALRQDYDQLKIQQETNAEWVPDVLAQLDEATGELERLHREHAALEQEMVKQERGRNQLEEHLEDITGQLAEAAQGRRDLEAYLQKVTSGIELERKGRETAEVRAEELAKEVTALESRVVSERNEFETALTEAQAWASQLEGELDHTRSQLVDVREAFQAAERQEAERSEWVQSLEQQLGEQKATLLATQKRAHEVETMAESRLRELSGQLDKKNERLEQVEEAFTELEAHGKGLQSALDELLEHQVAKDSAEAEGRTWIEGLELQLTEAQAEMERLGSEITARDAAAEEHGAWARGLESELTRAHAEMERLATALEARDPAPAEEARAPVEDFGRELAESRRENELLRGEIEKRDAAEQERAAWARGLEEALLQSQAEVERLRAAHDELAKNDAQRARDEQPSDDPGAAISPAG